MNTLKGFILIEVIIAMGLLSIIMLTLMENDIKALLKANQAWYIDLQSEALHDASLGLSNQYYKVIHQGNVYQNVCDGGEPCFSLVVAQ